MYLFIAHENIKRFEEQLENCPDERKRETLTQLLNAEQRKLKQIARRAVVASRCGVGDQIQTAGLGHSRGSQNQAADVRRGPDADRLTAESGSTPVQSTLANGSSDPVSKIAGSKIFGSNGALATSLGITRSA